MTLASIRVRARCHGCRAPIPLTDGAVRELAARLAVTVKCPACGAEKAVSVLQRQAPEARRPAKPPPVPSPSAGPAPLPPDEPSRRPAPPFRPLYAPEAKPARPAEPAAPAAVPPPFASLRPDSEPDADLGSAAAAANHSLFAPFAPLESSHGGGPRAADPARPGGASRWWAGLPPAKQKQLLAAGVLAAAVLAAAVKVKLDRPPQEEARATAEEKPAPPVAAEPEPPAPAPPPTPPTTRPAASRPPTATRTRPATPPPAPPPAGRPAARNPFDPPPRPESP